MRPAAVHTSRGAALPPTLPNLASVAAGLGDVEEDKKRVLNFTKAWQKHDWTAQLDGGEY